MSDYNHKAIEKYWQLYWKENSIYKTEIDLTKPKYYVLDMFPYPSGAGLHVGHPLGYIASDILSRYKRHKGFNVLHPMGYDSFGLPAEQYAIQTGQHPAITTDQNIKRFREQLDVLGFSYDWDRELRTSDPSYYKWTQWIFIQIYHSWYNNATDKAEHIDTLIFTFNKSGNQIVNASCDETKIFSADEWNAMSESEQQLILMNYRIAYLSDAWVNWCPQLGSVLANDEIKDGVSERGGFPVERKLMKQWSMRITAYAQRLLDGLENLDWSESIKESQRNWIGRSEGCSLKFEIAPETSGSQSAIDVFTTRPDTIFGATFLTLAPEHELVNQITTYEYKDAVTQYVLYAKSRSERERQADVKRITGQFTGAYAIHPFTQELIPIWIGEYVLAGYGTGAVMAVPAHDSRDYAFAKHFNLPIKEVISGGDISVESYDAKDGICINSDFLNGLSVKDALKKIIQEIENRNLGKGKIQYRLRDAAFGRQRYWGEPIPVYYKDGIPYTIDESELPLLLPEVDKYQPTTSGEPPLARAENWYYSPHPQPLSKGRGEFDTTSDTTDVSDKTDFQFSGYKSANTTMWNDKKQFAREMRKNPTEAEELLWQELRNNKTGFKIRRQHWINEFCADFICLTKKTVIEVDGEIHEQQKEYDEQRSKILNELGFKVIRFKNEEVLSNKKEVFQKIKTFLESQPNYKETDATAAVPPSPSGEGQGVRRNSEMETDATAAVLPSPSGEGLGVRRYPYEHTTMPGWAGSSWYYLRYMDVNNSNEFASKDSLSYWQDIDFYLGGAEHATGHLLYVRFWTKFLKDFGYLKIDEPAKKLVNQGMIQGRSNFVYRIKNTNKFVSKNLIKDYDVAPINVDVNIVHDDVLDIHAFKKWREDFSNAEFILEDENKKPVTAVPPLSPRRGAGGEAKYICGVEIEKMSKSKYNVVNPEDIVEQHGADCLRMYEMFLGPLEQHKPWNTNGISGVAGFLKKIWRLFENAQQQNFGETTPAVSPLSTRRGDGGEAKTLHKTIKKISFDIEHYSFNTSVAAFMICVNELTDLKCSNREILQSLAILLSPFAPHIAEEFWKMLGNESSITQAAWPQYDEQYIKENSHDYPVSINGKVRFKMNIALDLQKEDVEKTVMNSEEIKKYLNGDSPKKVIVVHGKIVNVVL